MRIKNEKIYIKIAALIFTLTILAGCGSSQQGMEMKENSESDSAQIVETETASITEEVVEESIPAEENNIESISSSMEWIEELNLNEQKLVIWNEETQEKNVLEDGQTYQLKENDRVLWFVKLEGEGNENNAYVVRGLPSRFDKQIDFENKYNGTFVELTFEDDLAERVILRTEESEITALFKGKNVTNTPMEMDDIDFDSNIPGEEWFTSIGNQIEDPFVVVWNDTDGTKKMLKDEETKKKEEDMSPAYQLKKDDVFCVYVPYNKPHNLIYGAISEDEKRLCNGEIIIFSEKNFEYSQSGQLSLSITWVDTQRPELGSVMKKYNIVIN